MRNRILVLVLTVAFAVGVGRCDELVKGKLCFFSDAGIIAQKVDGGLLLWGRDNVTNGKTLQDADVVIFLRVKNTRKYKKGMAVEGGWFKYVGTYKYGNALTVCREFPAFVFPNREEIEQAEHEAAQERMKREAERRKVKEQKRFEDEQKRIRERAEQEKINLELQKQREENDRKLAAERAKAEIEAEKQRQESARRAEEERKRRYPIEQKERAEYAKVMLSKISFDVNSYFDIQKDLKRFIYSVSVTEKKWSNLNDLRLKNDWLGILNVVSGNEMKDYPDQSQIASIIDKLENTKFHAEFIFTHKKHHRDTVRIGWVDVRECYHAFENPGHFDGVEQFTDDSNIVTFSMAASEKMKPILYAKGFYQPERKLFDNRSKQLEKINSDIGLGKITQSEAEKRRNDVEAAFRREVAAWIQTSKVSDAVDVFDERIREGRGNVNVGKKSGATSSGTKSQWVTCPDCGGSRYISKGKCPNCDGAGKYRTALTRGIGGRTMGGKIRQCDKCKGSGEIKETCKACYGRGKVKQQ